MASVKTLGVAWTVVYSNNTLTLEHPVTGWMWASDFMMVRGTLEIVCRLNNIEVALGYQTADVENSPDTAVAFGGYKTSNGVHYPAGWEDISSVTQGKQLIRMVLFAKNASGSTVNMARVACSVDVISE
ncbi:MAG: hypothetical protein Q8P18_21370 [Pseudomonadota bacterium]|nr:hypothetical protein [Pseudomonadota bacterium]